MKLPQLIGVVQLPALAGSPKAAHQHPVESLHAAGLAAVRDAQALVQAGFDGILIENSGDAPYFRTQVPPETVASLAIIAAAVRDTVEVPVGIHVLRNDARAALAIATVTGCDFIRINVLSGVIATDQGLIEGDAAFLLRERARLNASVGILADVHVKHGVTLSNFDIGHAVEEVVSRSLADGVIITGRSAGRLPDFGALQLASRTAKEWKIPIYLGSGVNQKSIGEARPWVDGVIVGSGIRKGASLDSHLDPKKVRDLVQIFTQFSRRKSKAKIKSN